jgi:hypothetical protein
MDEKSMPDESQTPLADWERELLETYERSEVPTRDARFGADFVTYFDE